MSLTAAVPLLVAVLTFAGGCAARTETFDVDVRNATGGPLTLTLAKDGRPFEPTWAAAEDVAFEPPPAAGAPQPRSAAAEETGQILPPGKTAFLHKLTGRFDPGVSGFVRVYAGRLTVSQMLSKSPGSPDRVDVRLVPGVNRIVVVDTPSGIRAEPEK